jgi:hypothetical protein
MRFQVARGFLVLSLIITSLSFTQCILVEQQGDLVFNPSGIVAGGASLDVFKETVYPLTRQHCASCHANSVQPFHASANAETAMNALLNQKKIDFNNPDMSRLVRKPVDENHGCGSTDCATLSNMFRKAIVEWGSRSSDLPDDPIDFTRKTVEHSLSRLASQSSIELTFPLDDPQLLNLAGSSLKVTVDAFDEFSYRIRNIRIESPGRQVHIAGVRVLLNGRWSPKYANYAAINQVTAVGGSTLSPSTQLVTHDKGPASDTVAFAFDQLSLRADPAISRNAFNTTMYPISRNHCLTCHATGAGRVHHGHATLATAHDIVLNANLVNFDNPSESYIVQVMQGNHFGNATRCGANGTNGTAADCQNRAAEYIQAIRDWGQAIQE